MLLWVNVHGGFVMGFVLLGLYLASAAIRYYQSRDGEESRQRWRSGCRIARHGDRGFAGGQSDQSVRLSSCTFMFTDIFPAAG